MTSDKFLAKCKSVKLNKLISNRDQLLAYFVENYSPLDETIERVKKIGRDIPRINHDNKYLIKTIMGLFSSELEILAVSKEGDSDNTNNGS